MSKCTICHAAKSWDELDDRGRCRSCRDTYLATLNGLHYGDYMARKSRNYTPVTVTPLRELPVIADKICAICGSPLPSNCRKYCSCECAHEAELQRNRAYRHRAEERSRQNDER